MEFQEEVVTEVLRRLRRAEGQVRGVERMLVEERDCREIINQLAAAIRALEQAGVRLLANGLTYCIQHPDESSSNGYTTKEIEDLLLKLR